MQTLALGLVMAVGLALVAVGASRRRLAAIDPAVYLRSLDEDDGGDHDEFDSRLAEPFLARVLRPTGNGLFRVISRCTPVSQRDHIRQRLIHAGIAGRVRAEDFLAIQFVAALGGILLALVYLGVGPGGLKIRLLAALLLVASGVLAPQSWLSRKVSERKEQIFLDMPDVLDLLAISVEAGVGFEGALDIVCQHFDSPLALEFSRTLKEMELGLPRREALQNLKRRTEVPELSNFVLALTQADALGMPIGRVLHTQAAEMRQKRRQWAREKAGKLPVKILFPLVLFIFPAVLIVVLGPAAATIGKAFK